MQATLTLVENLMEEKANLKLGQRLLKMLHKYQAKMQYAYHSPN